MATTRDNLKTELARRLGDTTYAVFSSAMLDGILDNAIKGLYPRWFERDVATTVADDGPIQTMPAGCRNLYSVGLKRTTSTRVRSVRSWKEGNGQAIVPKTGIAGQTLVWCWTKGWDKPASGSTSISLPVEAEEAVLLRGHIAAVEFLLTDRVSAEKYHALQVRQAVSEDDLATTLDALHASYRLHVEQHAMAQPDLER